MQRFYGVFLGIFFLALIPARANALEQGGFVSRTEVQELNRQISEKRQRISEIEKHIETYKKSIAAKQAEQLSLVNQIAILDNRLEKARLDIESSEEEIATVNLELKMLDVEIQDTQRRLVKLRERLSGLLRTAVQEDRRSYVEIMLSHPTFSDFFNERRHLQDLYADIGDVTKSARLTKEKLDAARAQKEGRQKQLLALKIKIEGQQVKLESQRTVKARLIAETRNSELKFKKLLGAERAEYEKIENEIAFIEKSLRRRLEASDKFKGLGEAIFSWPLNSHVITATFRDPDYPYRHIFEHTGLDLRAPQGTAVYAAAPGFVARVRDGGRYGYTYIMLVHTGGYATVYGHLSSTLVNDDEFVGRGDIIALSGGSPGTPGAGPFATGPHLHFEVRLNGIPLNPLDFLP